MYTIEEFDTNKSKVLKYILYKKRSKQEVKNKFSGNIDSQMLADIIDDLEEKGYITRGKRKTNKGWNNIYYINKYLIAGKKYETKDDQVIGTEEFCEDKKEDSMQISINEKLIEEQANLSHLLSDEQLERLNKMDTDR